MNIEQIYTGCLAQGAYYIESNGEVAIIDPLREVQPYIEMANSKGHKIKWILETHFHADFVSGHIDLSKKTGATIVYGPTSMKTGFDSHISSDGEILKLGNVEIKVIHTPGHTMESTCFLLKNETGKDVAIFTGDTLFIGDVGRPDLAQKVISDLTPEILASNMYHSLRNKIIPLSDDIIVYPAHGAGSACGKKMSKETYDTLGNQKKTNYALNLNLTEREFIDSLLNGLTPPPGYFPENVLMNISGYKSFDQILETGLKGLTPEIFESIANSNSALILDTRSAADFALGFIPNSINIGLDGQFAPWVGTLITDIKQPILIVSDEGTEEEVITRLSRVGYDSTLGYLKGGINSWIESGREIDSIETVYPNELINLENLNLLDVRKNSEWQSQHINESLNIPLDYINENINKVDKNKKWFVFCAGGYRSMMFISILRARGWRNLINVNGGFNQMKEVNGFKVSEYVCPTTLL